jgi:hypothetical protein
VYGFAKPFPDSKNWRNYYVKIIRGRQRQPFSDYNRRVHLSAVCAGGTLDFGHIRRRQHQHFQSGGDAAAPGTAG